MNNKIIELMRTARMIARMALKERNFWKRGNRHHVSMSKAAWKIRAHKRARWEMAKLSRRANRGK